MLYTGGNSHKSVTEPTGLHSNSQLYPESKCNKGSHSLLLNLTAIMIIAIHKMLLYYIFATSAHYSLENTTSFSW